MKKFVSALLVLHVALTYALPSQPQNAADVAGASKTAAVSNQLSFLINEKSYKIFYLN